jgi:hypothetical protein
MKHLTRMNYLSTGKPAQNLCLEGNGSIKHSDNLYVFGMNIDEDGTRDSGVRDRINLGRREFRR